MLYEVGSLTNTEFDKAVAHEDVSRFLRIDTTEANIVAADFEAEEHLTLLAQCGGGFGTPKWLGVLELQQITSDGFDPLHFDLRCGARKQATGFHPFAADDPCGRGGLGRFRFGFFGVGNFALFFG